MYPPQFGITYLAGLWKVNLARDLCWYVRAHENCETPSRAKPYRAPTWSWASVEFTRGSAHSPTIYQSHLQTKFEQFESFIIRHAETRTRKPESRRDGGPEMSYGEVTGGLLRIKCCLVEAYIFMNPFFPSPHHARHTILLSEEDELDQDNLSSFLPKVYLDVSFKETGSRHLPSEQIRYPIARTFDLKTATLSLEAEGGLAREDCLYEGSKVWICMVGKMAGSRICALVLKERERANFRRFERVGYLKNDVKVLGMHNNNWSKSFMRRVEREKVVAIEIF